MAQVILCYPDSRFKTAAEIQLPIPLVVIGTQLERAGFDVCCLDFRLKNPWQDVLRQKIDGTTICVGISAQTPQVASGLEIARFVRSVNPRLPLVWGGVHSSITMEQSIKSDLVDYLCVGEGEFSFLQLVRALEAKSDVSAIKGVFSKRDGQPVFAGFNDVSPGIDHFYDLSYHLAGDVPSYLLHPVFGCPEPTFPVFSSRGCPFSCTYCYHSAISHYKKWRKGTIPVMFKNFSRLSETYSIKNFALYDDNFFINKNHACGFARKNIETGKGFRFFNANLRADHALQYSVDEMKFFKDAGLDFYFVGAESGSDRVLKLMNKGYTSQAILDCNALLNKAGISSSFSFIISYVEEEMKETQKTLQLMDRILRENPRSRLFLNVFFPHAGSTAYKRCVELGMKTIESLEGWADYLAQRDYFNDLVKGKQRKFLQRVETNHFEVKREPADVLGIKYLLNILLMTVFRIRCRYKFFHGMFLSDLKRAVLLRRAKGRRYSV